MKVVDIVNTDVLTVSPRDNLAHVRRIFLRYGYTKIPVFEDNLLVGAITEMEVARAYERTRGPIDNILVEEVMTDNVVSVLPDSDITDIIPDLVKSALTVVMDKENRFVGVLTKSDVLRAVLPGFEKSVPLSSVATFDVKTIRPDQSIFRAVKYMKEYKIKHLPVIESGGDIVGIVSAKDLALSTFGLRPKKVVYTRRTSTGVRHSVRIVPQTIGSVMRTPVETASPRMDIRKAAGRMLSREVGSLVVVESRRIKGIATKSDLLFAMRE